MARKLHHKKLFRANRGFDHLSLDARVMRVLKHQKEQPIGIRALEVQARILHQERGEFYDLLKSMEQRGELWRKGTSVVLSNGKGLIRAEIVSLNEKFGFARPQAQQEGEQEEDIFLPGRMMNGAMPGDLVLVLLKPGQNRGANEKREGAVVKVLQESDAPIIGVICREPSGYYLRPDRMPRMLLEVQKGSLHLSLIHISEPTRP